MSAGPANILDIFTNEIVIYYVYSNYLEDT